MRAEEVGTAVNVAETEMTDGIDEESARSVGTELSSAVERTSDEIRKKTWGAIAGGA